MRILHTADWHLGRLFYKTHLTDDQAHVLDQITALAKDARPDLFIVAGDIFDRANPPVEAVELLDDVLTRLVRDLRCRVLMIAGNHDSPSRLEFGSRLLAQPGLHVYGRLDGPVSPLVLDDAHGPVAFVPIPYAEPPVVRQALGRDDVRTPDEAMRALIGSLSGDVPRGARLVMVAHAFVTGGAGSDSERPLSVGTLETVGLDAFAGWDYVALGHLHGPQQFDEGRVRYSGSPMKYSFSEAAHRKSVTLLELGAGGERSIEEIALTPRRDLRRLKGTLDEIRARAASDPARDDYLEVELMDEGALLDPMGQLRLVYPNVMSISRPYLERLSDPDAPQLDRKRTGDVELFEDFFAQVIGRDVEKAERAAFADAVEAMERARREAGR
ncbi:MAG: exonuclease SbcCD subunit D [Deltaproteobacteria bacterium]|nr:exonuclease SbcCD subunit D [Deltaproteobacteria bacterium]